VDVRGKSAYWSNVREPAKKGKRPARSAKADTVTER
jgi:hypothetical protein